MNSTAMMLLGLAVGIAIMIILVAKTKIPTFMALLIASIVTGIIGGMPAVDTTVDGETITGIVSSIQSGFGNTLKSTGIIVGLGIMLGAIMDCSGASKRIAYAFIKLAGKGKEEWALALTGWLVSIPIFSDSGNIIFAPLCKSLSKVTGKSVVGLGLCMACGLQLTNSLVPPTPGPVFACEALNVDVGKMMFCGALCSLPMLIAAVLYSNRIGKEIYQIQDENGDFIRSKYAENTVTDYDEIEKLMKDSNLPGLFPSALPILLPIVLIFLKTLLDFFDKSAAVISLAGSPIIALLIGVLTAIALLTRHRTNREVVGILNKAMKSAGSILLITGAGGSLGQIIKDSGIGNTLGTLVVNSKMPAILIPFIIAALMRIALGSATVSINTAATLTAPILTSLNLNPLFAALSCCMGSIAFSYFNDSGFWVFNGLYGLDELSDQLKCKTAVSLIMAFIGLAELLLLNLIFK